MFLLDQESKHPLSFLESYRIESKYLVEEYMLLANILIAEHLYKYCSEKTLLRVHPDVDQEKKELLQDFYQKVGLGSIMDLTNSKTLSISMEKLRETCMEEKKEGESGMERLNVAVRKFLTCLQ
jgi:exoribonuclease R